MRTFILLLLLSLNAHAVFVAEGKINSCVRTFYTELSTCQSVEQQNCLEHPEGISECGIYKIEDILEDDFTMPIWGTRSMVESCATVEDCQQIHAAKVCVDGRTAFYSAEDLEVWCNKIIGYEKKLVGKQMVIDQVLKAQKDQEAQTKAQIQALIVSGAKARTDCQRVLDLIAGFNLLPGRTSAQAGQMVTMFAEAKQHLQDGRPAAAKVAIQEIPVDGELVTQEMKDLALNLLSDW